MSENHSVETEVSPKRRFGGQGATPRPDSEYPKCMVVPCWRNKRIMSASADNEVTTVWRYRNSIIIVIIIIIIIYHEDVYCLDILQFLL